MNIEANFKRDGYYFWVPRATLACCYIGRGFARTIELKAVPLFLDKPPDCENYHRCEIKIVRTKREAAERTREWAKRRALAAKSPPNIVHEPRSPK